MLSLNEYRPTVRRPYPPFQSFLFLKGFANQNYFTPFFNKACSLDEVVVTGDAWYCSDKQLDDIGELTLKLWKNRSGFLKTKRLFLNREKKLLSSAKRDLSFFAESFQAYQPAVLMISYSESMLENFVRELLLKKISPVQVNSIMNVLNNPVADNIYKKEEFELVTSRNLKAHVKKYSGLYSRYGEDRVYTLTEAKERLKNINKKEFIVKYFEQKNFLKKEIARAKSMVGKKWSHIIDAMQFSVYYRTQRADILHLATYNFIPQLKKISKKLKLTHQQLLFCTSEEILAGEIPSKNDINKRIKKHGFVMENGIVRIVIGQEYDKIEKYFNQDIKDVDCIKGVVAQRGIISGVVKKIYLSEDYKKFKKDQILITSMTTPDMVPIMKKAAAIITDEGGVTCHAAIIARELKKPCIIGTKIATKVLHDGDLVEVDAERGIIKILKRVK